jgi:hypothetical protein
LERFNTGLIVEQKCLHEHVGTFGALSLDFFILLAPGAGNDSASVFGGADI